MRKLTGSRDRELAKQQSSKAAAEEAPPAQPTPRSGSFSGQGEIEVAAPVMVTPPGGGPPIPMLPLTALPPGSDVTDPNMAYQLGMQAGVAAAMQASGSFSARGSPSPVGVGRSMSSRERRDLSSTPSRAGSVAGSERPPRPRRTPSFTADGMRRQGSFSRSEAGSELSRPPRGFARERCWGGGGRLRRTCSWPAACMPAALRCLPAAHPPTHPPHRPTTHTAAGEEEDADEFALGSSERPPAALRAPSAGVCASFRSDHQKPEAAALDPSESALTRIVMGARAGACLLPLEPACLPLLPEGGGDGVRAACLAPSPAARSSPSHPAPPRLSSAPAERTAHLKPGSQFIKSFWMTEGVRASGTSVVRQAVHKVNKQPVSIKFYG